MQSGPHVPDLGEDTDKVLAEAGVTLK
jgi:hypothetical protein